MVGVNRYQEQGETSPELQTIDEADVEAQIERLHSWRARRDQSAVDAALREVGETARGTGNVLFPMREALRLGATLGEVSETLRHIFGVYTPGR